MRGRLEATVLSEKHLRQELAALRNAKSDRDAAVDKTHMQVAGARIAWRRATSHGRARLCVQDVVLARLREKLSMYAAELATADDERKSSFLCVCVP